MVKTATKTNKSKETKTVKAKPVAKLAEEAIKVDTPPGRRIDPSKPKPGDVMAILTWAKVNKNNLPKPVVNYWEKEVPQTLQLTDLDKLESSKKDFSVIGVDLIENMFSADQSDVTKEVTQSDMIDTLMMSYNVPFTATWELKDGSETSRRCRLLGADGRRGYSKAEDLDKPTKERFIQIDHRTLSKLIVQNVCYVLKKK